MPGAQHEFDTTYVTSSEICKELGVSRATLVHARRRGLLPDPVVVNGAQIYIWKRDIVRPFMDAWKIMLASRRGQLT
jgi:predicted site-specific integrase-resolvase